MKSPLSLLAGAVFALAVPAAALAQTAPGGPPQGPPPPQMRAKFEAARTQAQTAALSDLSADHRVKVQAILTQVQDGTLDPRAAGAQIDALLTPGEAKAVLAEASKLHASMQKAMAGMPPPPHPMNRKPDAGRFLIMISRPPMPPRDRP